MLRVILRQAYTTADFIHIRVSPRKALTDRDRAVKIAGALRILSECSDVQVELHRDSPTKNDVPFPFMEMADVVEMCREEDGRTFLKYRYATRKQLDTLTGK